MTLWRRGARIEGTLHLTQHHIIFSYLPPPSSGRAPPTTPKPREIWITYPMIAFGTYRPVHPSSHQQPSIRLRCRDFTFVSFHFLTESKARDVFETIKNLTCRLVRLEKLYAFSYQPQGPEKQVNGWKIYDPVQEYKRLGVGTRGGNRGWRFTNINADYEVRPRSLA